jgi:chaperonin GroES
MQLDLNRQFAETRRARDFQRASTMMLASADRPCENPAPAMPVISRPLVPLEFVPPMKLVPLGDKVIIRRLEADERTAGGILLPDSAREKPQQGRVLSVGDGPLLPNGNRSRPVVQEGDRVVFHAYAGNEVKIADQEFLICREDDILAILD